jgi:23S rRNA (guanosine2251-2'-O)-methyltransferase
MLYGRHAVHEALRARRRRLYNLYLGSTVKEAGLVVQILGLADQAGCRVQRIDRVQLDQMLPGANHQGLTLEVSPYPYVAEGALLEAAQRAGEPPLLLLLDHLEDPQNVGTLLRTAEAMAVHGVILPRRRAAGITPAVSNASSGAVEHLLIAEVTNLARTQEWLKNKGIWIAGLDDSPSAQELAQSDLDGPLALVVGNEAKGLSRLVREKCDWLVRIPMLGQVQSLNAAIAGSVVLVAARQARRHHATRMN